MKPNKLFFTALAGCSRCPELVKSRRCIVPGYGVWPSKVMFIAQSPGTTEDQRMVPLIGRSGLLLKKACRRVGWNLDQLYRTNVVLCHPANDRKSTKKEQANCYEWLLRQITTVDPEVIISLGDDAYRVLLPNEPSPITQIRGSVFKRDVGGKTRTIIPTFHPAYVGRNERAYMDVFVSDLTKARRIIDGEAEASPIPFATVKAPWHELLYTVHNTDKFGFDLETDGPLSKRGRPIARNAEIVGIGVCAEAGKGLYYPCPDHNEAAARTAELRTVLESTEVLKVVSNAKFEKEVLHRYNIDIPMSSVRDTLLEAWLLGDVPLALKDAWNRTFGTEMIRIDQVIGKGKKQRGMREATYDDEDAVVRYAVQDPDASLRLHEVLYPRLVERGKADLYHNVELPFTDIIIEMEENGFGFDPEVLEEYALPELDTALETSLAEVAALAGREFNPRSPQQSAEVLYGSGRIPTPQYDTATHKNPPTDKVTLAPHIGDPLVRGILSYRATAKMRSTYVVGLPEYMEADWRIHCFINQTGTSTGRVSSSEPNLTNIPARERDDVDVPVNPKTIRNAFVADVDNYLYAPDLSQIEMRMAAHLSKDSEMIKYLTDPSGDIHSNTAEKIFKTTLDAQIAVYGEDEGVRLWKNMRYLAKTIGFGVLYGLTAHGLLLRTPTLELTIDEAAKFIQDFYSVYSGLYEWQQAVKAFVRHNGYYETMLSRRRYFPDATANNAKLRNAALNQCVNFPVQGGAADYFKLATLAVKAKLVELGLRTKLVNQVHDEIVMEGPKEELEILATKVVPVMNTVYPMLVPIRSDFEYGKMWGNLKEWKATA